MKHFSAGTRRELSSSTESLVVGGHVRTFLLVSPRAPSIAGADSNPVEGSSAPAAVVLVLHGSNQTGRAVRAFSGHSFDTLAASGMAAVVYPDGVKKLWNHSRTDARAVDDVAFMAALVDNFHAQYGPIPVIVVGYSNGGQLVIRLIHEIPEKLDGATIVSATLPRPGGLAFADRHLPLPVLLIHGTRDRVVRYAGEGSVWGRFGGNRGPSAKETAAYFAARNGITKAPDAGLLPHRPESGGTHVRVLRFEQPGCEPVQLYTVVGGGHVVPNRHKRAIFVLGRTTQDISTVEALMDFFPALQR
ncbi:alpha/beta hydrolase family esterase [Arthrobacter cryoconiti]|uniref:Alpha/beta hydrolase family esterase n=1 Tax=Arthrobacter cryoconiti TaxID=748907 RepID=A0ABV8R312_9MICC|nr:hypothetical protein [Arthrobacter cryoconiti]MCC9067074.1 hypothetical protein [Arthrobacter cryoconiti]